MIFDDFSAYQNQNNIGSHICFYNSRESMLIQMIDPQFCQIRPKSNLTTHHGYFVVGSGP